MGLATAPAKPSKDEIIVSIINQNHKTVIKICVKIMNGDKTSKN